MNLFLSTEQICSIIQAAVPSDTKNKIIKKLASLESATDNDCAFVFDRGDASVFDPLSADKIAQCRAALLIARHLPRSTKAATVLLVEHPLEAFKHLVNYQQHQEAASLTAASIDPSACIASSAVIGQGSVIEAGVRIDAGVVIGQNCRIGKHAHLHPNVVVEDHTEIGSQSIIHAGTILGSDGFGYIVSSRGLNKIPHIGNVKIGSCVEIGAQCAIDRALFESTIIGDGTKIDNLVHIAHNVVVGYHCAILAHSSIGGSTHIGNGCQIGGHVVIKDNISIAHGVKIVSTSSVIASIPNVNAVMGGQPAMPFTQWKRTLVALQKLPELYKQFQQKNSFMPATQTFFTRIKQRLFGRRSS